MEAERGQVAVRAAVQALDAALAEHRRGMALAASRRERERIAGARAIKSLAAASDAALEQPVDRPIRLLRLAETWIEVDRSRHRLDPSVHAMVQDGELRVRGEDWSARIALAPGDGPAAAAAEAVARIEAAGPLAGVRARERMEHVIVTGARHAAACHAAATALAAADRELSERHADHARVAACSDELAARLGDWRLGEPPEIAAARDRLAQARAHLAAVPEQPYRWVGDLDPPLAGALLRDVPPDRLDAARPAAAWLAAALHDGEPLLALAATDTGVIGLTSARVLVGGEPQAPGAVTADGDRLLRDGRELATGVAEQRAGRLAAALELVQELPQRI